MWDSGVPGAGDHSVKGRLFTCERVRSVCTCAGHCVGNYIKKVSNVVSIFLLSQSHSFKFKSIYILHILHIRFLLESYESDSSDGKSIREAF